MLSQKSSNSNAVVLLKISLIILLCSFLTVEVIFGNCTTHEVEDVVGEWFSVKNVLDIIFEKSESGEIRGVEYSAKNISKFATVDFLPKFPLNLTRKLFVMKVKLQNINISKPLSIVFFDDLDGRAFLGDLVSKYGLWNNEWGIIAVDSETLNTINFSSITRIRFNSFDEALFSQTIWVKELNVVEYEENNIHEPIDHLIGIRYFLSVLFLIFIFFSVGFVAIRFLNSYFSFGSNIFISWPFHAALGICLLVLVMSFFSIFRLDIVVSGLIVGSSVALFSIYIVRSLKNLRTSLIKLILKPESLVSIFVFVLSVVGFSYLAINMNWPIPGDSFSHGRMVSLIIQNGKTPFDLMQYIRYPMGFQFLGAFSTLITGMYPGQGILILATSIVILMACLIFSTMYRATSSTELSIIGYSFLYFLPESMVPLWRPSQNLFIGKFLPGVYPNLLGDFLLITFFSLQCLSSKKEYSLSKTVFSALIFLALIIVYFPLLPLFVFFYTLKYLLSTHTRTRKSYMYKISFVCLLTISFLYLNSIQNYAIDYFDVDVTLRALRISEYSLLKINSPYFIYLITAFVALPFSIWLILKKEKFREWGIAHLTLFIPVVISLHENVYKKYLWFLRPDRLLIILVLLSYFIIIIGFQRILGRRFLFIARARKFVLDLRKYRNKYVKIALAVFLILVTIFYFSSITSSIARYYSRYDMKIPSRNDYLAMEWLATHTLPEDVILNDRTMVSAWLPSFQVLNVINDRDQLRDIYLFKTMKGTFLGNRTIEANKILAYPWNYGLLEEIAGEYDIKYIYISESNEPFLHLGRQIYLSRFPWKRLTQKERITMYLMSPSLDLVFKSGDSVIFKINSGFNENSITNYATRARAWYFIEIILGIIIALVIYYLYHAQLI